MQATRDRCEVSNGAMVESVIVLRGVLEGLAGDHARLPLQLVATRGENRRLRDELAQVRLVLEGGGQIAQHTD